MKASVIAKIKSIQFIHALLAGAKKAKPPVIGARFSCPLFISICSVCSVCRRQPKLSSSMLRVSQSD